MVKRGSKRGTGPLLAGLADTLDDLGPGAGAGAGKPGHGVVGRRAEIERKGGKGGQSLHLQHQVPMALRLLKTVNSCWRPCSLLLSTTSCISFLLRGDDLKARERDCE
jgi:hypothetical protein